ncbi:hypothetical protein [Rufibacter roseolus]|nr:hypothetical protein [Rufibacter roseolus]
MKQLYILSPLQSSAFISKPQQKNNFGFPEKNPSQIVIGQTSPQLV